MLPPRRRASLIAVSVLLAACATPPASGSGTPAPTDGSPSPSATETASSAPSASAAPTASTPTAADPPPIALEPVAGDLVSPIGITGASGGWLLVNEQAGRVVAIHPDGGKRATVVDLSDHINSGDERGLLGLALHPEWPAVGRAFVHYTGRDNNAVLSELSGTQDGDGPPALDAGSEVILLGVPDPYPNHNGGQLAFGPDGHLWFGLGDGGSGGDPQGNGQNPATLLGSILRLDVSEPGELGIPADNPFADGAGGAPEVYLFGLRNPWRFSFDLATGLLWIADVGQGAYEEVNRIEPVAGAGANFGWNLMEGAHCFADPGCSAEGLVMPIAEYGRDLGYSVTGGHVYRGAAIAGLKGWYLFADYGSGIVFGIPADATAPADGTALAPRIMLESGMGISSFGVDEQGELYVVDHGGGVLSRIVAGGG